MKKDKIFIGLVVVDAILLVLNLADSILNLSIRSSYLFFIVYNTYCTPKPNIAKSYFTGSSG